MSTGLGEALRSRGFEVEILAPADAPVRQEGLFELGRTVGFPDNGSVTRIALSPASVARTARLVRRRGYDLVHLHEPMLPHACFTALHAARVPVVGTFHMLNVSDRWYRLFGPVIRRAATKLSARIAVSEPAREFAERSLPGRYRVIPNGLDLTSYRPRGNGRGEGRLLFVGRPDPRKGLPVLLQAFARLPGRPELELAGVEPGEVALERTGSHRGVLARVRAHGRVTNERRHELLSRADVLCAPSLGGESFGLVVVEGMAAGLPVVASDIPGYRDVLPPSAGRLVRPGDGAALAAALAELLDDAELRARLGGAGSVAAERYDWSVVAGEVVEVYEQALAA